MEILSMQTGTGYRQLNLVGFTLDVMQPLALFKDDTDETTVPLWLEMGDVLTVTAALVSSKLSGKVEKSDLLDALLAALGLRVAEILVDGSAGKGYIAQVRCSDGSSDVMVPVTLVTALLTAIRFKLPVGISAEALASSALVDRSEDGTVTPDDERSLLEMLEKMTPEEMGKYPM
jgi:bifunctional DNase/RNase